MDDCKRNEDKFFCYGQFVHMWKTCFSHVKIREYKAVSGKCLTCELLSRLRQQTRSSRHRQKATYYHHLHRSAYMGEKLAYYDKRKEAMDMPMCFHSTITDGMAKTHTRVPWYANLRDSSEVLNQHLQGVLCHGRFMKIYRTFHNVKCGANTLIHTWLMALEETLRTEKRLPDTLYFQVDGGCENVAKATLGICELLVIKRLTKRVVYTRLPVGHTHEDIDSKFAKIWTAVRDRHCLSPLDYEKLIKHVLRSEKHPCDVEDIFVVPDYRKLIDSKVDKDFGNYAKTGDTVLQFIFEAVERSSNFPLGCKVLYVKYYKSNFIMVKLVI